MGLIWEGALCKKKAREISERKHFSQASHFGLSIHEAQEKHTIPTASRNQWPLQHEPMALHPNYQHTNNHQVQPPCSPQHPTIKNDLPKSKSPTTLSSTANLYLSKSTPSQPSTQQTPYHFSDSHTPISPNSYQHPHPTPHNNTKEFSRPKLAPYTSRIPCTLEHYGKWDFSARGR